MSSRKINIKNFFFRKKDFFDALELVFFVMRSCRNCATSSKIYCINNDFKKYVKCVRSNRDCNLTIFSTLIKRIYEKQMRLKKEVREAHTKLSQLKK